MSGIAHGQESSGAKIENLFGNALRSVGNLIASKSVQLKTLVEKEEYPAAQALWAQDKAYFEQHAAENEPVLERLAAGLNAAYEPRIEQEIQLLAATPLRPERWPDVRTALASTAEVLNEYDKQELLAAEKYRSPKAVQLARAYAELMEPLKKDAPVAFLSFDHPAGSFFQAYPIEIKPEDLLAELFRDHRPQLAMLPPQQIAAINKAYGSLLADAQKKDLAGAYVAALTKDEPSSTPRVISAMKLGSRAKRDGFEQFGLPADWKIGVLVQGPAGFVKLGEAEAQFTLLAPGTPVEQALATVPHLIVLRPTRQAVVIAEAGSRKVNSSYVVGKVPAPNDAYRSAYDRLLTVQKQKAAWEIQQQDLDRQAKGAGAFGALLAGGSRIGMQQTFRSDEQNAQQRLKSTPMVIAQPVARRYEYEAVEVEVRKSSSTAIFVVDAERKTVASASVALEDKATFSLSADMDPRDAAAAELKKATADFGAYRSSGVAMTLENLTEQLGTAQFSVVAYAGRLPAVAASRAAPAGDETRKFVAAMQKRLAAAHNQRGERAQADRERLAKAGEEAQEAGEDFQRKLEEMGAEAQHHIDMSNMWAAGLRQLGQTVDAGQARVQAARQGRIYTPPAGTSSGDAVQDALDEQLRQINALRPSATR